MDRTCQQEGSFKENKNYKETDACNQNNEANEEGLLKAKEAR